MANPSRSDTLNAAKDYRTVIAIQERDAMDFGFNEAQARLDLERKRAFDRVFKDGAILAGMVATPGASGALTIQDGIIYLLGRAEPIAGAQLAYEPTKVTGIDTVFIKWISDIITKTDDATLANPSTNEEAEDRLRIRSSLATSSPDAMDELFESWIASAPNIVPLNWTLMGGACTKGYPAKFGETALRLDHTNGTETKIEREIVLTPSTTYTLQLWVRTADDGVDLIVGHGAIFDLERSNPLWVSDDFVFASTDTYVRKTFQFTTDANSEAVKLRIVIPSSAPSTSVLIDSVVITTSPLINLEQERHYVPLLFWDRATNVVTRAISRAYNLQGNQLEPPILGEDIEGINRNQGLLDLLAEMLFDAKGHFRVPPGLDVKRNTNLDSGNNLGLSISSGRAWVKGYVVKKQVATDLLIGKALTTKHVEDETQTFSFGKNLYTLNKAASPVNFPIEELNAIGAQVVQVVPITKGAAGGQDSLSPASNVTDILGVGAGTVASITGTQNGPYTFTATARKFRVKVSNYDGSAGSFQEIIFAVGTYTKAEVLEALQRGSGRAYYSGKIVGNVEFADAAPNLNIKTLTRHGNSTVEVDTAANGSDANTVLGFTDGQSNTGTGTRYVETTDWLRSGDYIDWSPGGAEPGGGSTYYVALRKSTTLIASTDYKLGGVFPSLQTYHYKVAAFGASGEGIPGTKVTRSTPAGSINRLSWAGVPGATFYAIYRSTDDVTYNLLKVIDAGATTVTFDDDGSLTPDSSVHPSSVSTTTTEIVSAAETDIDCTDLTNFPTSGTVFLEGSDLVTYSGKTSNTLNGCSGAIDHASGVTVRLGPDMSIVSIEEGELGVLNLTPQGAVAFTGTRGEPEDQRSLTIDYDYYQPRIDVIAVNQQGLISSITGVSSDDPLPPPIPETVMDLAQVRVEPNSTTLTIQQITLYDRMIVRDVVAMDRRVEQLYRADHDQAILAQIDKKDLNVKRGLFADAIASFDQLDILHPIWNATADIILRVVTPPTTLTRRSVGGGNLTKNGSTTTTVQYGQRERIPSTEITLIDQPQWSECFRVNPYDVYPPGGARVGLNPSHHEWTYDFLTGSVTLTEILSLLHALETSSSPPAALPPWWWHGGAATNWLEFVQEAIRTNQWGRGWSSGSTPSLPAMTVQATGSGYAPNEDNIAGYFNSANVSLTPVSPTIGGTNPGTVKADAFGRWKATFTLPAASFAGTHDFEAKSASSARAAFNGTQGLLRDFPDPLGQTLGFDTAQTISGIGVWFCTKDATLPIRVQIREVVNGVLGPRIFAEQVIAPSEITLGAETKVLFDDYFYLPGGTTIAFSFLTDSTEYSIQVARLGAIGQNPVAYITSNPYARGVLLSSSNNESWTIHQDVDLRMKVYGRQFSASAILEFNNLSSLNLSDLWLGASQFVPEGASLTWEYELNGETPIYPIEIFNSRRLNKLATGCIVRARLATTNNRVSPAVEFNTIGFMGWLYATSGVYISRGQTYAQTLSKGKVYFTAHKPSGTTITPYISSDDGLTWTGMELDPTVPVEAKDEFWSEYTYRITGDGDFANGTSDKRLRIKIEMTATNGLTVPRFGAVGASVS